MKNKYIIASLLTAFLGFQFLSFTAKTPEEILNELTTSFHEGMNEFERSIQTFKQSAIALDSTATAIERLRAAHINNRLAFKAIEYLLAHSDEEVVKKYLNGAPLPTVEPNLPEVNRIDPEGLQVLDELVFRRTTLSSERRKLLNLLVS
ncbi:MAG: hypothetical protein HC892_05320 [Saprospiraceae bacterium]|nr:hypothetical protein [Saprospiraceae bacterium]